MAGSRGARQAVENANSAADGRLVIERVRESEPRAEVVAVGIERRLVVVVHELEDAVGGVARHTDRRRLVQIPIAEPVIALPTRQIELVAQTYVDG